MRISDWSSDVCSSDLDANESWGQLDLLGEAEALAELGVGLIEQPVPVGTDALLDGIYAPLPFVADESCHTAADIARIGTFYDGVNIKIHRKSVASGKSVSGRGDLGGRRLIKIKNTTSQTTAQRTQ